MRALFHGRRTFIEHPTAEAMPLKLIPGLIVFRSRGQILQENPVLPLWGLPETSLRPGFLLTGLHDPSEAPAYSR